LSESLLFDLERINNTRVGYYDRRSGEQTILVSIKEKCDSSTKITAAFKILKCAISYLRRITDLLATDTRYLLCAKFFLFYLFGENPIVIKPTIDKEKCVICTRGKNARINEIESLLVCTIGHENQNHEIQFMRKLLKTDVLNDTSITIPASIVVYQRDAVGRKLCEFDGLIIHPMRKANQIIFLEAKNTSYKPAGGKKCLMEKLNKLLFEYSSDDIMIDGHNAYWNLSV